MSNSGWSPKREVNLTGIFSYNETEVTVEKSNRWQQQRALDGTPYTRHGASALTPPLAGPKLYLNGLEKSMDDPDLEKDLAADTAPPESKKSLDPSVVVKAYLSAASCLLKGDSDGAMAIAKKVKDGDEESLAEQSGEDLEKIK